jgi:hypothetical protein
MKFTYQARDRAGSDVYGEVEARDRTEAERQIRLLGLTPVEVERSDALTRLGASGRRATDTRSDRATGVVAGCATGWFFGLLLVVVGVVLTATGIGAIIGVPLIIAGIVLAFAGPFLGLGSIKGACPYCGGEVHSSKTAPGVTCPACLRRIVIRDGKYHRAD